MFLSGVPETSLSNEIGGGATQPEKNGGAWEEILEVGDV